MPVEFLGFLEVVFTEKSSRNFVWKRLASEFVFAFPENLRPREV
jgi:hypothetical protein